MSLDGNPFQSCPIEIVREIFEIAARNTAAGACALALVSRDARRWITPFLYQTLVITKPNHIEAIITNSFNSLLISPMFLAQHVHHLAFVWAGDNTISMWDDDVIQCIVWLLRECKSLRSLLADSHLPQLANLMPALPHLTRIHCFDSKLPLSKFDAAGITHLYLHMDSVSDLYTLAAPTKGIHLPPRVSHLGLHIHVWLPDSDDWSLFLSLVSQILQAPSLVKLVITLSFEGYEDHHMFLVPETAPFTDTRLCLLKADSGSGKEDVLRGWEMEARGEHGIWDRGSQGKPGAILGS
jgi:hypothetical protein